MTTRAFTFILLITITWLVFPETALAQTPPPCPDNWSTHPPPGGTSPNNVTICTYDLIGAWVGGSGVQEVPCNGQNVVLWPDSAPNASFARIHFTPNTPLLTNQVTIGFTVVQYGNAYRPDDPELAIDIINDLGRNLWSQEIDLDDYWYEWVFGPPPDYVYFRIWYIYTTTPYFGYDISSTAIQIRPLENPYVLPFLSSFQVGAIRIVPADQQIPVPCNTDNPPPTPSPFPYPTLPPTFTPTGTFTPPTATPTPNGTPTPFPTSPLITITPLPTRTPIVFSTLSPLSTPTPWPTFSLPTLSIPTIAWPDLAAITPSPVIIATEDSGGGGGGGDSNLTDSIVMIATQWANEVQLAATALSPSYTIGITTADQAIAELINPQSQVITPTYGALAPPIATLTGPLDTLSTVISFFRSIQIYFPTIWPLLYAVLIAFGLVIGTYTIQFIIYISFTILEFIRRLWEAIPLN